MRFAISLGMLLGMTHGWVMAESPEPAGNAFINSAKAVYFDTNQPLFGSNSYSELPY